MTSLSTPDTLDPSHPRAIAERSERLLRAVRTGEPTGWLREELATYDRAAIDELTDDPDAATAFWLNVYNAIVQLELGEDPDRLADKRAFFTDDLVEIAGERLSLNAIEHGIIRGEQWPYGLGYVPWLFYSKVVSRWALDDVDYRIQFALNCGAASCPPIAAYTPAELDEQLDMATRSYLDSTVQYDADSNVARLPRLCLWYRGDFGGRSGLQSMLERYEQVPPGAQPRLRYLSYDWAVALDRFVEHN